MKIRLKTIIILSYVFIILIFFLGIILIVDEYILTSLTEKHIFFSENGVEELTKKNEKFAKRILLDVSRNYIDLYAEDASKMLSPIIRNIKYEKLDQLSDNEKLRKLICQPIQYKDREMGYTSLIDTDSRLIIHPDKNFEGRLLSSWKEKFPGMWKIFKRAEKDRHSSGYYNFWATGKKDKIERKYMSIVRIPKTELYICSYMNFGVICDPLSREFRKMEQERAAEIKNNIESHAEEMSGMVKKISIGLMLFLSLGCVLFALWIANKITKPITRLNIAAKKMGEGDFNAKIEEKGSLEIDELSNTFNNLGKQLVLYVENLKKEITAREHLESELKIARNIQMSILQQNKLHDPRSDVSLFATLYPAKDVAGDFYDFFYLDEEKRDILAVLIADASGKGIYAAIFMAMAKTVIKNLCQEHPASPAEALRRANNLYLNSENMFVTMFLAYYNIKTGELLYANGGHHSAVHISKQGSYKEFGVFNEPLLGLFPDNEYQVGKEHFEIGDKLFLYTDGVTEAINKKQEPYGEDRLKEELLNNIERPLNQICSGIFDSVSKFEEEARFDDITMLILKRDE